MECNNKYRTVYLGNNASMFQCFNGIAFNSMQQNEKKTKTGAEDGE